MQASDLEKQLLAQAGKGQSNGQNNAGQNKRRNNSAKGGRRNSKKGDGGKGQQSSKGQEPAGFKPPAPAPRERQPKERKTTGGGKGQGKGQHRVDGPSPMQIGDEPAAPEHVARTSKTTLSQMTETRFDSLPLHQNTLRAIR